MIVDKDEHPRGDTTMETLSKLSAAFREGGSVTAGNSSGINDGACAMIIASEAAAKANGLTPRARILGAVSAGVPPRVMGIGPVPATQKLLAKLGMTMKDFDTIELNEAFAAQALAVLRQLGLADDAENVNPNGGAIALGHPLGASGGRLMITALNQLEVDRRQARALHHVHRRRPGHRAGARARLRRLLLAAAMSGSEGFDRYCVLCNFARCSIDRRKVQDAPSSARDSRGRSGKIQQEMHFIPILASEEILAMPRRDVTLGLDSAEYSSLFISVTWR